jgi:putative endonuclease
MYFVYELKSESRRYLYVGMINDIERRTSEHQRGKETTTSPYRPFKLLFVEKFTTRIEARLR